MTTATRTVVPLLVAAGLLLSACGGGSSKSDSADQCSACTYHTLVWADEFNGTGALDSANWSYDVGAGWNNGANMFLGWGNNEIEWYRPEQAERKDGYLVITADYDAAREPVSEWSTQYRSARIVTQGKQSWGRARIEARAAVPSIDGAWPAFWLMGDGYDGTHATDRSVAMSYYDQMASYWPACGEVDIFEHRNMDDGMVQNVFWDTRSEFLTWNGDTIANDPSTYRSPLGKPPFDATQFHVYAVEWTATTMSWFIDGELVKTRDISGADPEEYGADRKFFILFNLALGGESTAFTKGLSPAQADYPIKMYVDWVRVYQ